MLKKSLWQHQQMQNGKKNVFFVINQSLLCWRNLFGNTNKCKMVRKTFFRHLSVRIMLKKELFCWRKLFNVKKTGFSSFISHKISSNKELLSGKILFRNIDKCKMVKKRFFRHLSVRIMLKKELFCWRKLFNGKKIFFFVFNQSLLCWRNLFGKHRQMQNGKKNCFFVINYYVEEISFATLTNTKW